MKERVIVKGEAMWANLFEPNNMSEKYQIDICNLDKDAIKALKSINIEVKKGEGEKAEKGHLAYSARRVGKVANDDRVDWSRAWHLSPSSVVYCWHADRHASEVQEHVRDAGFEHRAQIVWVKANFPISRGHYTWRHEPCWYAVKKETPKATRDI